MISKDLGSYQFHAHTKKKLSKLKVNNSSWIHQRIGLPNCKEWWTLGITLHWEQISQRTGHGWVTNAFTFTSHCLLYTRHYFRSAFKVKVLVTQSCLTLCDPMNCNLPGSSVLEISQARIQEWVAIPFSRGCFRSRNWTQVSRTAGRFLTTWTNNEAGIIIYGMGPFGPVTSSILEHFRQC